MRYALESGREQRCVAVPGIAPALWQVQCAPCAVPQAVPDASVLGLRVAGPWSPMSCALGPPPPSPRVPRFPVGEGAQGIAGLGSWGPRWVCHAPPSSAREPFLSQAKCGERAAGQHCGGDDGGAGGQRDGSLRPLRSDCLRSGVCPAGVGQSFPVSAFCGMPGHALLGSANAETTPARAPAAAADRKQRPDATCEGKNG